MPPERAEEQRAETATARTEDTVTTSPTESAEAAGPQSRQLTAAEAARMLANAARGQRLAEDDRHNLTMFLESVGNRAFTEVVRILDRFGVLQTAMRELYGTAAEEGAGENQREVPVMCYRFWNAANQVDADVTRANTIYNPHGVFVRKTADRTISRAETGRVVGHDVDDDFRLDRTYEENDEGENRFTHADMAAVVARYVPRSVIGGLWAKRVINQTGADLAGTSSPGFVFPDYNRLAAVATDHAGADTFAHELGHILTNEGHVEGDVENLMASGRERDKENVDPDRLTEEQLGRIRASALTWARRAG